MATHAIGKNNELVGICLDRKVKSILGREAQAQDRSLANYILSLALERLAQIQPVVAENIRAVKAEKLRLRSGIVCLIAGYIAVSVSMTTGSANRATTCRVWRSAGIATTRRAEA